jgi:Zn-dependent protease
MDEYEPDEQVFQTPRPLPLPRRRVPVTRTRRFSAQETKDLGISIVLVTLVAISLQAGSFGFSGIPFLAGVQSTLVAISAGYWWVPVGTIVMFLAVYLIHEMAHKFMAQRFGMWAEFRMTMQGYYLSAIAIVFAIPIFGTGAVFTSGAHSREEDGLVNFVGPFSNFIFAALLAMLAIAVLPATSDPSGGLHFLLLIGIALNSFIGLFNMIPIQPFDGGTVYGWNKKLWAILAVALLILLIFGYFIVPMI